LTRKSAALGVLLIGLLVVAGLGVHTFVQTAAAATPSSPVCTNGQQAHQYLIDFENPSGASVAGPMPFGTENAFAVDAFIWGATESTGSGTGSGSETGKTTLNPFNINMSTTVQSPLLVSAETRGSLFQNIVFYGVAGPCIALEFDMKNALISSYQISGPDPPNGPGPNGPNGNQPEDQLSIVYQTIVFSAGSNVVQIGTGP
jgi:type VI protein secretion system component Hcp